MAKNQMEKFKPSLGGPIPLDLIFFFKLVENGPIRKIVNYFSKQPSQLTGHIEL